MDGQSAYEKLRESVKKEALKYPRLLDIAQHTLWLKMVGIEAFVGKPKSEDVFTFTAPDGKFGFSEGLVNQLMQFASSRVREGYSDEEWERQAFQRGYDAAREEFAKATGLYTEQESSEY